MEEKMGRRERKKLQARQSILDAAVQEFSNKGFQSAAISDIMDKADMGVGTFYNYFTSKEELLQSLLDRMTDEIQKGLLEMQAEQLPQTIVLPRMIMLTARLIEKNRFVLPLFLSAGDSPNDSTERTTHAPSFMNIFILLVEDGQATGEFRKDIDPELVAEMFHSLFQAAAFSNIDIPFQDNIQKKLLLIMDGLCNTIR